MSLPTINTTGKAVVLSGYRAPMPGPDRSDRALLNNKKLVEAETLAHAFGLTHLSITAIAKLANLIAQVRNEAVR